MSQRLARIRGILVSFRHNGEAARKWSIWLDKHRDDLVRSGVPDFLYSERLRWFRLLEEDGWDPVTGWKVEMLPAQQAVLLHSFVIRQYGRDRYRGLIRALESVTGQL
jgi:hypothetical protein